MATHLHPVSVVDVDVDVEDPLMCLKQLQNRQHAVVHVAKSGRFALADTKRPVVHRVDEGVTAIVVRNDIANVPKAPWAAVIAHHVASVSLAQGTTGLTRPAHSREFIWRVVLRYHMVIQETHTSRRNYYTRFFWCKTS